MSDADRTTALADALLAGVTEAPGEQSDGERASRRDRTIVEVGIGERTAVAAAIADRSATIQATDVVERSVPDPIGFHVDDLSDPDGALYAGADLLYALRLPPELHGPFARLAADIGAPAAFTTLGGDPPTVATTPEQVPGGETIHWIEHGDLDSTGRGRDR